MDTKAQTNPKELRWYDTILYIDVRLIHKPEHHTLLPDILSRREELIIYPLLVLVEHDLDIAKNDILNNMRNAMKHYEVKNNRFLDKRGSKKKIY